MAILSQDTRAAKAPFDASHSFSISRTLCVLTLHAFNSTNALSQEQAHYACRPDRRARATASSPVMPNTISTMLAGSGVMTFE